MFKQKKLPWDGRREIQIRVKAYRRLDYPIFSSKNHLTVSAELLHATKMALEICLPGPSWLLSYHPQISSHYLNILESVCILSERKDGDLLIFWI